MALFNLIAQVSLKDAIILNNRGDSVGNVYETPSSLINIIVPNLFILAGTIFFFLLIAGGLSIIASGATDGVEKGKKQITTAVLGFVIMFAAYWIVQVIEYLTGVPIFNSNI